MKIKIDKIKAAELRYWFTAYVGSFKSNDREIQQNIDLKEDHTMRVCKEILSIGTQLGLNDDELRLAEIISLLHDIGRFEQFARYKTFMDSKSEDHAELGIKILKQNEVLEQFNNSIKELIYCSIKYHSKPSLPGNESETCMFYSKLIRDADKLGILNIVTRYYQNKEKGENEAIVLELPDTPGISEKVYRDLMNKRIVNLKHLKNLNDFKLLQAGWIFDINFQPTLDIIKKRHYLDMIREVLPKSKEIDEIFDVINSIALQISIT